MTFETDAPMVPLLVHKIEEIVRFEVYSSCNNGKIKYHSLIKLDFFYENIYRPDVEVGYGIIKELRMMPFISSKERVVFLPHLVSIWLKRAPFAIFVCTLY